MVTITIFVTGRTMTAGAAATDTLAVTPGRLSPDVVDGGTSIVGQATAAPRSSMAERPGTCRSRACSRRQRAGWMRRQETRGAEPAPKRRRTPRVASALVPTPVPEASAVVIDEAVAGLDAIAPAEVEQHPPSVGTARRALSEARARE